ncbi:MAG: DUF1611 domain-containing protein [Candidatus Marinimicrobia bacterium]|nr:DUF1611 domain-containing protein [Candidatus Neomarinimicrobiota bacterium]MCF7850530.1 DUF1611 domain-containing protein [Candidatus Neomarinimicrobiota bacterium]MCF7905452.1 DUF1611 domain-containing protein [Candidatus Neomarinimicrobiota bacterium]
MPKRRFILYAQDRLNALGSKTANGMIMFRREEVVAIVDQTKAGKTAQDVLGYGGNIPVVADVNQALTYDPDVLIVGIAPIGGAIDPKWIPELKIALEGGVEVWAGLHQFLSDIMELRPYQDLIWDARKPPEDLHIAKGNWRKRKSKVLLTIGSDSNVGKMTTALLLQKDLKELGLESVFLGTGQTGMMISGRGVAVDSVISDFVNGATEAEIDKVDGQAPLIIVEGQGAITHMGYSGVTMGLLHGAMPDGLVIAHQPSRLMDDYKHHLPNLQTVIDLHESLLAPFKISKVLGINIYSKGLSSKAAEIECRSIHQDIGLPVEDMAKASKKTIAENVIKYLFPEGIN